MTETRRDAYRMNPAEDRLIYGDELAEGMWVLPEDPQARCTESATEDEHLRMNRFCRVTRMRAANNGQTIVFIGEWIDGYQKRYSTHRNSAWIVKRDPITAGDSMYYPETPGDPS